MGDWFDLSQQKELTKDDHKKKANSKSKFT